MDLKVDRIAWIEAKQAERKKQREKEELIAAEAIRLNKDRLWSPYRQACLITNELNIAWKAELDFFNWTRVFPFRELVALRITGHELKELPVELPLKLPLLECLSLISNGLLSLPDNIGLLVHLTAIDLTKNKLQTLPDSICELTNLTSLNLSDNRLESLPHNFGNLICLSKIWMEKNQLKSTPPTFGKLRCISINFNCNQFSMWDIALPELCNLTTLTINMNHLTQFPLSLCCLPSLTSLSAANNTLTTLPNAFGTLVKLKILRLDWNQIRELPLSFRFLVNLEEIHMEHNPLVLPPLDVVYEGAQKVIAYVQMKYFEWLRQERRTIVEQLEAVFEYFDSHFDNQWADLRAYFEPNIERTLQGTKINFYAVVISALTSEILPLLAPEIQAQKHPIVPMSFFDRSAEDIVDALTNFDDNYGTAGLFNEIAHFKRCMCVNPETLARQPCQYSSKGYVCERSTDVCLVRYKMFSTEVYKEMQGDTYLFARRERLSNAMKRKCVEFINSQEGIVFFEKTAETQGKLWMENRARREKEAKQQEKKTAHRIKARMKTNKQLDIFQKKQVKHDKTLCKSIVLWEKDIATLDDTIKRVKKRDQLEKLKMRQKELQQRLVKARNELDKMQDDPKKKKLEAKLAKLEKEESSAEEASDDDQSEPDKDNSDDNGSDDASESNGENSDKEAESDEDDASSSDNESSREIIEYKSIFDDMGEIPGLEPCNNWIEAATEIVNKIMASRPPKDKPYLEDVVALFHEQLHDTYVKEKTTRVTTEYYRMKYVLRKWMGHGHRIIFVAWRDYVRGRVQIKEKSSVKQKKDEALAVQNQLAHIALGRLEATKWEQKMNYYTDQYFYKHTITGEVSLIPPPFWDDVHPPNSEKTWSSSSLPPLS
ncbi:hypothetical protein THRCLA_08532 [Thraustotheca clavata]|uniref:Disease resistance R13L4/SHOC-2-like LRR domain-containing protein n=1 Tax=Thraustotheca clavata TaxID=74557 RepID=A0A1V9Z565_9STRA|nr:hypothetical protein THRCLA_08532 [Thraustotheca clavata]